MDKERRRALKAIGKAEVQRQSIELRAALDRANPAKPGDDAWASNYKQGREAERWLRTEFPVLNLGELERKFSVWDRRLEWTPMPEQYVQCGRCLSAGPSQAPRKLIYWKQCACGNIKYRVLLWWRRVKVRDTSLISAVRLVGKAQAAENSDA